MVDGVSHRPKLGFARHGMENYGSGNMSSRAGGGKGLPFRRLCPIILPGCEREAASAVNTRPLTGACSRSNDGAPPEPGVRDF